MFEVFLIKMADLGHPSRPTQIHLRWSQLVQEEFWLQVGVLNLHKSVFFCFVFLLEFPNVN